MRKRSLFGKPSLSVIVVFFNMQREAVRTLFSLSLDFQENLALNDYEVIIIDSNSTEPLDKEWVESQQSNFRYFYVESEHPSPCKAMNFGVSVAKADTVVCHIDGARILSPRILSMMLQAKKLFKSPFTYTIGMHLGEKIQNLAIVDGYSQEVEDTMLFELGWEKDGYKLFKRCCLGGSATRGYFMPISESNCFSIDKSIFRDIGGFDERFISPGGGVVNLDVFKRLRLHNKVQPVMLLGEATFHQFHGGVATNVLKEEHPFKLFLAEYKKIRNIDDSDTSPFVYQQENTFYLGSVDKKALSYFVPSS